MKAMKMGKPSL